MEEIKMVNVNKLHNFKGHPFLVETNAELFELMQSIEKEGVIVPLLVRKNPYGDGYEMISGHRRREAAKWAGLLEVPVVVRELDDDQAVIAMVDSNLQREHLKPSEKAFAYKMKIDALNHQGKKWNGSLCQVDTEYNPTIKLHSIGLEKREDGYQLVNEDTHVHSSDTSGDVVSRQVGESRRQVYRYIRLTYLIPKILDWVDQGKIAFSIGVELSYLTEDQQYELYAVMDLEQCTPSLSQANRLRRKSQQGEFDMDVIYSILEEEKPNQKEQIKIKAEALNDYFPKDFTPKQKVDLIKKLVKDWYMNQEKSEKAKVR